MPTGYPVGIRRFGAAEMSVPRRYQGISCIDGAGVARGRGGISFPGCPLYSRVAHRAAEAEGDAGMSGR
ncbi:hypothetical protein GCM10009541_47680 [Micromonospora gifhornensis]